MTDLPALRDHLKKHKVTFVHDLLSIDGIKRLTVEAPEGGWLEFYEAQTLKSAD